MPSLALLLLFASVVIHSSSCSDVTGFFHNKTPFNLTLDYYTTEFGSYTKLPPDVIPPYATATCAVQSASVPQTGGMGLIKYDVYYRIPYADATGYCVRFTYEWDLVGGSCDSNFIRCPIRDEDRKRKRGDDCRYALHDQCAALGNPIHVLSLQDCQ